MYLQVFLFVVASVIGATEVPENLQESVGYPEKIIQEFIDFAVRAKGPKGTYHRFLLIVCEVIPAPPDYVIPKDHGGGVPTERPLTPEYREFFENHINYILSSRERIIKAISKMIGNGLFVPSSTLSSREGAFESSESPASVNTDSWTVTKDFDDEIDTKDTDSWTVTKDFDDETDTKDTDSWTVTKDFDDEIDTKDKVWFQTISTAASNVNLSESQYSTESEKTEYSEAGNYTGDSITTDYIKYLTDGLSPSTQSSSSMTDSANAFEREHGAAENQVEQCIGTESLPEEYINFLQTDPVLTGFTETETYAIGSDSSVSEEIVTESLYPDFTTTKDTSETSSDRGNSNSRHGGLFPSLRFELGGGISLKEVKSLEKVLASFEPKYLSKEKIDTKESQVLNPESNGIPHSTDAQDITSGRGQHRKPKQFHSTGNGAKLREDEPPTKLYVIPGTPGVHFPNFQEIPGTNFTCENKKHIPGFYTDQESSCQVFHVCWPGRRESFLCPLGTTFNQAILACDYWYNSNCSISHAYFDVNTAFRTSGSAKTGNTGAMVDTLIKVSQQDSPVKSEIISSEGEIDELYEADVHFSETLAKQDFSKIWRFLPVRAKVFVQPQPPELLEFLAKMNKQKRSEKTESSSSEEDEETPDDRDKLAESIKETFETHLLKVLGFLAADKFV